MNQMEAWVFILYVFVVVPSSALDDCIVLRHVMTARLDISLVELHRQFAVRFDAPSSVAQIHTLLED